MKQFSKKILVLFISFLLILPNWTFAQNEGQKSFSREQLEQITAPIALYPDALISQILMASTYPLEIVKADRWVRANKDLKGDTLAQELEKQNWDPSVKSLVNFPQVLQMMSDKLDWTQNLGDAFLADEKAVMDSIQSLRRKADSAGNLKSTKEQKVIFEKETIIIEPSNPQVIYVPVYNPTVVYGVWAYPAYPPFYYYPPGYISTAVFYFGTGFVIGTAWGYAWGRCNWWGGNVNININQNIQYNQFINRTKYEQKYQSFQGRWQHDGEHRRGVAYRDSNTARQYGQFSSRNIQPNREARGFNENLSRRDFGSMSQGSSMDNRREAISGSNFGAQREMRERGNRVSAFSGSGSGEIENRASQRGQFSSSKREMFNEHSFGGHNWSGSRPGGRR
ncbi:MAG TPA: DUF3300 domain-containing protein [Nitrospirae bacterium]|nr:DUF3300 domain-containing protein [Nitrospirota bacterium]